VIVRCNVKQCGYWNNWFCEKPVVDISFNGYCRHVYNRNGAINKHFEEPIGEEYKERNAEVQVDSTTELAKEYAEATVAENE
jgi:hypothetical protein